MRGLLISLSTLTTAGPVTLTCSVQSPSFRVAFSTSPSRVIFATKVTQGRPSSAASRAGVCW